MAGIDASLKLDADFIVNTDADNQYAGRDISKLLAPLLRGEADIVIGDRNIRTLRHMPRLKRWLQLVGSWVVRQVSNTRVPDTTSGFRAYSREAALRQTIVSDFSYTLESIIQAGKNRMAITYVPVATNENTRESRLFGSVFTYVKESAATIIRIYAMYEPLKVFTIAGLLTFSGGLLIAVRFLCFYLNNQGQGNIQSLILSAVLMIVGFQVMLIGLMADVISANRKADRRAPVPHPIARADVQSRGEARRRVVGRATQGRGTVVAAPASTSVIIPACNEGPSIGTVVRTLTEAATWYEILVVDDGSDDETAANASVAGARVIRHPYTKGNGTAVKTGLRQASGDFVLIIDGDGQHRAALAPRLVERLGEYDLVVGGPP